MKEEKIPKKKEIDDHYIGNIWGWKFSFISLGLILLLCLLYFFNARSQQHKAPLNKAPKDTIQINYN